MLAVDHICCHKPDSNTCQRCKGQVSASQIVMDFIITSYLFLIEFLHCTLVGNQPGSYMPNMAVPNLNKI